MSKSPDNPNLYTSDGTEDKSLESLLKLLEPTLDYPERGKPVIGNGFFANVLDLENGMGLAVSTDGVGTKLLVAQQVENYRSVGRDIVAVNVNDVLCTGARPIALTFYLVLEEVFPELETLIQGIADGAEEAKVAIVKHATPVVPEIIKGINRHGFDAAGTCFGIVPLNRAVYGQNIREGDVIVGLRSSGIHSNGLTLARRALFGKNNYTLSTHVLELEKTLGEELLTPTTIYTTPVLEALGQTNDVVGLAHISGGGLLNLLRLQTNLSPQIDNLPKPQPIFSLIQDNGEIPTSEMYRAFNMGTGFCLVVRPQATEAVLKIMNEYNQEASVIGRMIKSPERAVFLPEIGLKGTQEGFKKAV